MTIILVLLLLMLVASQAYAVAPATSQTEESAGEESAEDGGDMGLPGSDDDAAPKGTATDEEFGDISEEEQDRLRTAPDMTEDDLSEQKLDPQHQEDDGEGLVEDIDPKPKVEAKKEEPAAAKPEIVARAAQYGISEDEVKTLGEDKVLERMVQLDRSLAAMGGKSLAAPPVQQQPVQHNQPPAQQQAPQQNQPNPLRYTLQKMKRDDYAPEFVEEVESVAKHFDDHLDNVRAVVGQLYAAEQARQAQHQWSQFDNAISQLGPDYKEMFGEGPTSALTPDSPFMKARLEVARGAAGLYTAFRQTGANDAQLSPLELVRRAVNAVAGDKVLEIHKRKLTSQIKSRSGAAVRRPTQHERGSPTGERLAIMNVRKKLQAKGVRRTDE